MLPEARLLPGYCSPYRNLAPSSTGVVVKANAGQIYSFCVGNSDTNNVYLKLYNKVTAATNSDTPIMTLPVIKGTALVMDLSAEPIPFSTGISLRVVQEQADNGTTDPTSGTCTVNLLYK